MSGNKALLQAALQELSDALDYIASERGFDDYLYLELSGVEEKLMKVLSK